MIWNYALPPHFIPLRTIELSNTTKTPIPDTKSVTRTKTSVVLLTSPEELLDSVSELVASFDGHIGVVPSDSLEEQSNGKEVVASDAESREKALNGLLEKRFFRRTFDDLSLSHWDTLTTVAISRLSANSQFSDASYQCYLARQSYRDGLRLVCKESYEELSRGMERTLARNFSSDAVVFNDIHKSVTRATGIGGACRASLQNRADFFFPSSSDPTLTSKPLAHFAYDLERQKGRLLAPGIQFYPEKSTIFYQGTLSFFFEPCLSCPTPCTGPSLERKPAYTTTYENIRYLAVEQDPRDLMNVSYAPRNYGARLDGLEELTFVLEREKVARVGDGLDWSVNGGRTAQEMLEENIRAMIEGWGFGAPKRVRVCIAREFWAM